MRTFLRRYQTLWFSVCFIFISLLIVSFNKNGPQGINLFQRVVLEASAPIQWVITSSIRGIRSLFDHYIFLVNVKKENLALKERIQELQAITTEYLEVSSANERLRRNMMFKERFSFPMVAAEVIGGDVSEWKKTILINKGKGNGIEKGMAVLTSEGVVGQVIQASNSVAKVLLIIDHNSTIAVLIQRSRSRGILEGRTEDLCELKYVTRTGDVKEGDTVISSGLGGFYPKGILVGRVSKVEKRKYGIFQKVMVIPSVDFSRVEEVFIVTGS